MDQSTLNDIRGALERERDSVERQLAEYGVEGALDLQVEEGFSDSAHATAERAELLSLVDQLHAARAELAAALDRLEHGTYGVCESCEQPIAPERLEALPATRWCVTCKQTVVGAT